MRRLSAAVRTGGDPLPPEPPMALQVELTSRCQLRCRMCPLTTGDSSTSAVPGDMSPAVWADVRRLAISCGRVILVGYGEALLHAEAMSILRELDEAAVDVALSTNGIALTASVAASLARLTNLSLVNVSIDSPDPVVYREVRAGSLERAMAGLRLLAAAMPDTRRIAVSALAMTSTLPSLEQLPHLLANLGIGRLELQSVMDYTEFATGQRLLGHPELGVHLERIRRACAELGIELDLFAGDRLVDDFHAPSRARDRFYGSASGEWDVSMTRQCHVPWEIPFIDKDGSVFPCCFAGSQDSSRLGSLTHQSFEEIWHGSAFREFRRAITDGRTTPDICRRCTVAPLGQHLLGTWAASLERVVVTKTGPREARVQVTVRNTGRNTWTPDDHVRVATSGPRDTAASALRHRSWIGPNRPTELAEVVPSGGRADLRFLVPVGWLWGRRGSFELVAEGACWIPDTRFDVGT